ncbi:hypothetical protein LRAMOSA01555 [Lichtheimia ramosa]|uniref:Condensation domain-containing protein n=1 Tax=Lichtheimia ramosa TaxID=688394 RepID=A0A077WIL6_9FUNG|nr:hypothetical protein LRAMOSA01555 [Lichtheimia ramosa]
MTIEQRPLGLLEKYQISKLMTKCYGSVTTTALLRHNKPAPCKDGKQAIKTFYLDRLYPAVSRIVQKHPQLSIIVLDAEKPNARFASLPSFNLEDIVYVNTNVKFWEQAVINDIISTEVDKEFDTNIHTTPLWSLRIDTHPERFQECAISFTIHHVIGDGKSSMQFWKELLEQLKDGEMVEKTDYQIDIVKPCKIQPPQEFRNPMMPDEIKPPGTKEDELAMWQGDYEAIRDKETQRHDTAVRTVVVNGEHWPKVVKACKQYGVTPHAALMVACALAFAELYPDRVVRTMTPVNTRPLCDPPVPEDEMGNFFGNFFRFWHPGFANGKSFWQLAIEYQACVREGKPFAAAFANTFFGHLKDFPEDFINYWYSNWYKYPMGRSGGICFSDLGLISTKHVTCTEWQLQEIFFNQSSHMYTMALTVNTISTANAMHACISWQRNALDTSKADRYGSLVAKYLIQCIMDQ